MFLHRFLSRAIVFISTLQYFSCSTRISTSHSPVVPTHHFHVAPSHRASQRRFLRFLVQNARDARVRVPRHQEPHHRQIAVVARQVQRRSVLRIHYSSQLRSTSTAVDQLSRIPLVIERVRVFSEQLLHVFQIGLRPALHRFEPQILSPHALHALFPHRLHSRLFLLPSASIYSSSKRSGRL